MVLVSLDLPKLKDSHVQPFLSKHEVELPCVQLDATDSEAIEKAFPAWPNVIPVTVFVGTDGTAVRQFDGQVRSAELEEALAAIPR